MIIDGVEFTDEEILERLVANYRDGSPVPSWRMLEQLSEAWDRPCRIPEHVTREELDRRWEAKMTRERAEALEDFQRRKGKQKPMATVIDMPHAEKAPRKTSEPCVVLEFRPTRPVRP